LDFLLKLLVLELAVTLESEPVMTGASTTVTTNRPPDWEMRMSWNRPEPYSALSAASTLAASRCSPGDTLK